MGFYSTHIDFGDGWMHILVCNCWLYCLIKLENIPQVNKENLQFIVSGAFPGCKS